MSITTIITVIVLLKIIGFLFSESFQLQRKPLTNEGRKLADKYSPLSFLDWKVLKLISHGPSEGLQQDRILVHSSNQLESSYLNWYSQFCILSPIPWDHLLK